jgi:hypothetical protein
MYWRLKIWLLRRRDFVSESEFLRDNNLRRDHISDAMKGGPRLRLKWVKGEYYIDRDSAKIILERLAALKLVDTMESTQKAGLTAAAGAAIAAVVLASSQSDDADNANKKKVAEKKWNEEKKKRDELLSKRRVRKYLHQTLTVFVL